MRTPAMLLTGVTLALAAGWLVAGNPATLQGQAQPNAGFAAVPSEKGGLDITGPYEVVANWPKPLSTLPGHDNWTWGSVQGVFAESPNRVFMVQRGELPRIRGVEIGAGAWNTDAGAKKPPRYQPPRYRRLCRAHASACATVRDLA